MSSAIPLKSETTPDRNVKVKLRLGMLYPRLGCTVMHKTILYGCKSLTYDLQYCLKVHLLVKRRSRTVNLVDRREGAVTHKKRFTQTSYGLLYLSSKMPQ